MCENLEAMIQAPSWEVLVALDTGTSLIAADLVEHPEVDRLENHSKSIITGGLAEPSGMIYKEVFGFICFINNMRLVVRSAPELGLRLEIAHQSQMDSFTRHPKSAFVCDMMLLPS